MTFMDPQPVLIFDLGKVLVDFDYSVAARKVAARSTKAPADLHQFLGSSPVLVEYESGRVNRAEFFARIREAVGFQGTLEEFGGYFADIFLEMPETIALHAELKQRGLKTYLFSNTNDLAVEHVRRSFPFFGNFDGYILSFEVGSLKPQAGIYAAMEKLTGRRGADLVYLDDRAENIAAGAARGWRTILHESAAKSRRALAEWGLL